MADLEPEIGELPLQSVGEKLRLAREASGLSHADLAAATKIPMRHLISLEQNDYSTMPGRTYVMGFARSYAKAVGLDPDAIAHEVKVELDNTSPESTPRSQQGFEPGDPARVPTPRLAWLAALAAGVVLILGLIFWRSFYAPAGDLPAPAKSAIPAAMATPNSPASMVGASAAATMATGIATAVPSGTAAASHQSDNRAEPDQTPDRTPHHQASVSHPVAQSSVPPVAISASPAAAPVSVVVPMVSPASPPVAVPSAKPSTVTH